MKTPPDPEAVAVRILIREKWKRLRLFLQRDIWRPRPDHPGRYRRQVVRPLQVLILAFRSFRDKQCPLRASALTFYTILSIVPVAAMAFGVAKGFNLDKKLERQLLANFPGQEEVLTRVIEFANQMLGNTQGGLIAGIGVAALVWTVIKVLGHIEASLNALWEFRTERKFLRKISDYLAMIVIGPILSIIAGSVTVFIRTQILLITRKIELLGIFSGVIAFALKFLPFGLIWLLFSLVYLLMPNGRVHWLSGIMAGIISGTVYQLLQWGYIHFQVGVAGYNAIYGSFAALPLFLIWLQVSWLIVLFGAAIAAAHQNRERMMSRMEFQSLSHAFRKTAAIQIAFLVVRNFADGEPPPDREMISDASGLPQGLCRELLHQLNAAGVLSRVTPPEDAAGQKKGQVFQPALNIQRITLKFVMDALEHNGEGPAPPEPPPSWNLISERLKFLDEMVRNSPENRLLINLQA